MTRAGTAPRTVLVTGATGFVGRQVVRALAAEDVSLRLVLREGRAAPPEARSACVVATPDLFAERRDWWARVCEGVDTVIHLAWYAEPGQYQQSPRNLDCLGGTLELAAGAVAAGVRRFVGVGTCAEYDMTGGALSVKTPLHPGTPYAAAKAAAFLALGSTLPLAGVSFLWCRLFYLHGEGEDSRRLVPYLRAQLAAGAPAELGAPDKVRDFLNVRDAGRLLAAAALGPLEGPANVCSGRPTTIRALAEAIADEYGRRDLLRFSVRPDNPFDPPVVVGVPNLPVGAPTVGA